VGWAWSVMSRAHVWFTIKLRMILHCCFIEATVVSLRRILGQIHLSLSSGGGAFQICCGGLKMVVFFTQCLY
jgi:hypothetical protein